MIAKKPLGPRELLLKYVEFAGEFGHMPHQDPLGRKMPFYTLYMLDFFVPLALIILSACCLILYTSVKLIVFVAKRVKKVKTE